MDKQSKSSSYQSYGPGPGAYQKGTGKGSGFSFGKDRRDKIAVEKSVGPGMYDIPHSIPDVCRWNYPAKDQRKIHL